MKTWLTLALASAAIAFAQPASSADTLPAGGSQPVNDYQPSLALTQSIHVSGVYPPRDNPGSPGTNYLGMLRTFAGNTSFSSPTANGQILSIAQNTALFSLYGTNYGGNGLTTFALPDLGGRSVVGTGQGPGLSSWVVGQEGGQASLTLGVSNLPAHLHTIPGDVTGITGGFQPFDNLQPSLAMTSLINAGGGDGGIAPFVGQVGVFGGNFAPTGWMVADGSVHAITDFQALYDVIGATYGGDGVTTFALPDLRSRVAVGAGTGPGLPTVGLGDMFGAEDTFLTLSQLPSHLHGLPGGGNTGLAGASQPFLNQQPSLGLNYLIALEGIFPSVGSPMIGDFAYLSEVVAIAGDTAPSGWAFAQGQLLPIAQNQALFALVGTTFGGDGVVTFALPDLRGRTIIGTDADFLLGEKTGEFATTLTVAQMPTHVHSLPPGGPGGVVPEPSVWALMLLGFGLIGATLRRRRPAVA